MATLFKCESGRIINLDNVTVISNGRAYFIGDDDDSVTISLKDEINIDCLFRPFERLPIDSLTNSLDCITECLSSISESVYEISEAMKKP